jgi:hypothetical protein
MNITSAAIPMKISAVGFTSDSPNIPAMLAPSGATSPLGDTPAPPVTSVLVAGADDGCDGTPNVLTVTGGCFGSNTGSFGATETGVAEIRGTVATGVVVRVGRLNNGALKYVPATERVGNGTRGVNVVGAVYAMLPESPVSRVVGYMITAVRASTT